MVFKVSKGGVRSGNTLRGLHSTRTKRYGHHACLLGCTSLGKRDLSRLIKDDSDDDNNLVRDTLSKTNVLLSLNKQQRWRLPAMIGHMLKQGEFNKGATVSLLEKHKLKRRANCTSLVSNSPKTPKIAPKHKKYFSFSLNSFGDDESNRQKRRMRAEELKKLNVSETESGTGPTIIETYTADRHPLGDVLYTNKPEYRLEVFYPCPQSCSLTYNPKYTDVTIAEGKHGRMEVKSNVKTKKKGLSTHRKRLTKQDIDRLHCEEIENDVGETWEEHEDSFDDDESEDVSKPSDRYVIDNIIDRLLTQAKKTKELCINRRTKKNMKLPFIDSQQEKSHIVYIEKENSPNNNVSKNTNDIFSSNYDTKESNLNFFRVILPVSEISPKELRQKYGSCYGEASCKPRRFVLDVTEDISNLLATSKSSTREIDVASYLVCIYDGFYDDGLAAYKIAFNSMVGKSMDRLSDLVPFSQTSISEIMNVIACHLLDLKDKNGLEYVEKMRSFASYDNEDFVNSRIQLKVEVYDPHEISRVVLRENNIKSDVPTCEEELTGFSSDFEDSFCDVCYASVTPSRMDASSGTQLKSCGHLLCDECWASHFRANMKEGKTVLSCGGYDCNTKVGPVTLITILNVSEVVLLLQRQKLETYETMNNAKWCPYPKCGHVIKVDAKFKDLCVDVICACGNELCFSCFGPAHWPAKCEQAEEYIEKIPSLKSGKPSMEELHPHLPASVTSKANTPKTMLVEGRICPSCKRFLEKNGGCHHIVCRCGKQLCWDCMKDYHYFGFCENDAAWLANHTRILLVKHASVKKVMHLDPDDGVSRPRVHNKNRQKASLYQSAIEQREEKIGMTNYKISKGVENLVGKMVKVARADSEFKMEIMKSLTPTMHLEDETYLAELDVSPHLRKIIRSAVSIKKELHHVTEYTFILLQGTPHSVTKQRILKLTNDLNGFCSFVRSIIELGENQDAKTAFKRLVDLQKWAERALDSLILTCHGLRSE